jgi:multidrug transporter EmrE-like cation transporter
MNILVVIALCALYALLNVAGATLIKMELPNHNLVSAYDYVSLLLTRRVIMGFGIIFISALTLIKALSMQRFTYVVPVSNGLNFFITVLVGTYIFKDVLSRASLFGLCLILTGIIITSLNR